MRRVLLPLAASAIVVAALFVWFGPWLGLLGNPDDEAPAITAAARAPRPAQPADPRAEQIQTWVAAALARPLFAPSRRPAAQPAVASAAPAGPPRLTGVIVTPAGRSALFVTAAGGKPQPVTEGQRIGPYRVKSIQPGSVVVDGPRGPQILTPTFDPAPASAPAPAPAQGTGPQGASPQGAAPQGAVPQGAASQVAVAAERRVG
jgi:hypothetical protein